MNGIENERSRTALHPVLVAVVDAAVEGSGWFC